MNNDEFLSRCISSTDCVWEDNSYLLVEKMGYHSIRIIANREGLISLANQLLFLSTSSESSIIYHAWPGDLEAGSLDLEVCYKEHDGCKKPEEL